MRKLFLKIMCNIGDIISLVVEIKILENYIGSV